MYSNNQFSGRTRQPFLPPDAPRLPTIPLPTLSQRAAPTLHKLLFYAPHRPRIIYDIRRSPSTAQARRARTEWVYEPATNPTTCVMDLHCSILPEPILVFPSHEGYGHVIVRDVLLAVHEAHRTSQHAGVNAPGDTAEDWFPGFSRMPTTISTRYKWAGISEQIGPGPWILHIE